MESQQHSQIKLAAEAKQREQARTLAIETQVKKGTCCCFGFKVEKEQARLLLEAQALPISSHFNFYIDVSSALEDTKGLLWIGKAKEKARLAAEAQQREQALGPSV